MHHTSEVVLLKFHVAIHIARCIFIFPVGASWLVWGCRFLNFYN